MAGVAVIRVSGDKAHEAVRALGGLPREPRKLSLRKLRHEDRLLDEALVVRFDKPNSFTGEDVVEIHCHGGAATVQGILDALASRCCSPAEPGEFTRRAYAAGKLGLTEVEGLADFAHRDDLEQRDQALSIMSGCLERKFAEWRREVSSVRAAAEAAIDFGDHVEGEVDSDAALEPLAARVGALATDLRAALRDFRRTAAIKDGVSVVLAGPPNAGKSSLLNLLAARPAAIVSDVAGTTRDALEVRLNLGGYEVRLFDTAGLRHANDAIEAEGVRRAQDLCDAAHVVCYVHDASSHDGAALEKKTVLPSRIDLVIANKVDLLLGESNIDDVDLSHLGPFAARNDDRRAAPVVVRTSAVKGDVDDLVAALQRLVETKLSPEPPVVTRERHRRHVADCVEALDHALTNHDIPELFAEDLRTASTHLSALVGAIDVEDVLDTLFRDFCIGK